MNNHQLQRLENTIEQLSRQLDRQHRAEMKRLAEIRDRDTKSPDKTYTLEIEIKGLKIDLITMDIVCKSCGKLTTLMLSRSVSKTGKADCHVCGYPFSYTLITDEGK